MSLKFDIPTSYFVILVLSCILKFLVLFSNPHDEVVFVMDRRIPMSWKIKFHG